MTADARAMLDSLAMFATFSADEREDIASILDRTSYACNEIIFREGMLDDFMLLIDRGAVSLSKRLAGGGQIELAKIGAGDLTGEMSMVDGSPRSATAIAVTDVSGFVATRKAFSAQRLAGTAGIRKLMRIIALQASQRLLARANKLGANTPTDLLPSPLRNGKPASVPQAAILKNLPLIGASSPIELAPLFENASEFKLQIGDTLTPTADHAGSVYLILYGAIEARLERRQGANTLSMLGPGSMVGACSALTAREVPFRHLAREPTVVVEFVAAQVQRWLSGSSKCDGLFQDLICRQAFYELRSANRRQAWLAAIDTGFITVRDR